MPITVNWSDLEIAFERNSPDQESFLDLENGDLLSIVEGEPDAAARRARVVARAVPVDGAVRGVGVRPGAARTAVDRDRRQGRVPALQGCPARLPGRTGTLVRVSLGAAALPHSELARAIPTGEAPGEILRRQARELLDEIPAAELPPALAFLEFLRDRGPSSLLGAGQSERRRADSHEDEL